MHQAPAFGEDDYRVCLANGIIEKGENVPCPVDLSGRFAPEVTDFAGTHVKVGGACTALPWTMLGAASGR